MRGGGSVTLAVAAIERLPHMRGGGSGGNEPYERFTQRFPHMRGGESGVFCVSYYDVPRLPHMRGGGSTGGCGYVLRFTACSPHAWG